MLYRNPDPIDEKPKFRYAEDDTRSTEAYLYDTEDDYCAEVEDPMVTFECPYCDEELEMELGETQMECTSCERIVYLNYPAMYDASCMWVYAAGKLCGDTLNGYRMALKELEEGEIISINSRNYEE